MFVFRKTDRCSVLLALAVLLVTQNEFQVSNTLHSAVAARKLLAAAESSENPRVLAVGLSSATKYLRQQSMYILCCCRKN